eukprot:13307224-Alexandrium_andersonii.AAC.1
MAARSAARPSPRTAPRSWPPRTTGPRSSGARLPALASARSTATTAGSSAPSSRQTACSS